jgi:hypothetical protein
MYGCIAVRVPAWVSAGMVWVDAGYVAGAQWKAILNRRCTFLYVIAAKSDMVRVASQFKTGAGTSAHPCPEGILELLDLFLVLVCCIAVVI